MEGISMVSMTGYSHIEEVYDEVQVLVEIKSLNSRFLDINIEIPYFLNPYELEIKKILSNKLKRGKVTAKIYTKEKSPKVDINLDINLAKQYFGYFNQIINEFKLSNNIFLSDFLDVNGIIKTVTTLNTEGTWQVAKKVLDKSLLLLINAREKEGKATEDNVLGIIERVEQNVKLINTFIPSATDEALKKLKSRLDSLLKDHNYEEQRVLSEAGIMASETDISEELQRLESHLYQFIETCKCNTPIGKKLDFIIQEMFREVNTVGSKSSNIEVSKLVIDTKNELEKIKEQVRNIE
jgi:uncharacterized protein (TIGR00255 family)